MIRPLLLTFTLALAAPADALPRSRAARGDFQRINPCPSPEREGTGRRGPCPGFVVDHIIPLACGGPDVPENMQWQTVDEGKAKDRWELNCQTSEAHP